VAPPLDHTTSVVGDETQAHEGRFDGEAREWLRRAQGLAALDLGAAHSSPARRARASTAAFMGGSSMPNESRMSCHAVISATTSSRHPAAATLRRVSLRAPILALLGEGQFVARGPVEVRHGAFEERYPRIGATWGHRKLRVRDEALALCAALGGDGRSFNGVDALENLLIEERARVERPLRRPGLESPRHVAVDRQRSSGHLADLAVVCATNPTERIAHLHALICSVRRFSHRAHPPRRDAVPPRFR
jgi:hypothetical protein